MIEDDVRQLLATAAGPEPEEPPVERIVAAGRRRGRRLRIVQVTGTVAAVAAVASAIWWGVHPQDGPLLAAAPACPAVVPAAVLPVWARAGFTDPAPTMPYVLGERGEVAAILWPDLVAPPREGHNNKILWVAREHTTEPFTITARSGTDSVTTTMQQGPGPSTIDVPGPGCWTFDLRWGTHQDTLVLPYGAG
jgi:hypothetical protein